MLRDKLLEEMNRVDEQLAGIDQKIKEGKLTEKEKKELVNKRKKLDRYKKELLREWRHLNM